MEEKGLTRRTGDCRIKLAPDMYDRLDLLAKAHGFPMATMAAVAVADWVNSKELAARNQRMLMLDIGRQLVGEASKMFEAMADSPDVQIAVESVARKAQEQLSLPQVGQGASGV
jgi:predicted transcriptional regulator